MTIGISDEGPPWLGVPDPKIINSFAVMYLACVCHVIGNSIAKKHLMWCPVVLIFGDKSTKFLVFALLFQCTLLLLNQCN